MGVVRAAVLLGVRSVVYLATLAVFSVPAVADVIRPAEVTSLVVTHDGSDVQLSWTPVTLDVLGQTETIDHYNVYRGTLPDFVPDKTGGSNRVGTPLAASHDDTGAASDGGSYYYLISAVDADGNESDTKPALVTTPPVLSGFWTNTTIEIDWTDAAPLNHVVGYRVYYGKSSGEYEFVQDVGLVTTHSLTGLQQFINWYIVVTAVDTNGNESLVSNEHIDPVRGIVKVRAHDGDELCWGASDCIPVDPQKLQRNDGWQLLVPTEFPEGDWLRVTVTFTLESRLCKPGVNGTISKCGPGNPCPDPPCNGGYNPCGDPWDRTAHLFLVLDEDCIGSGASCIQHTNLELMRAITPFGTDAAPPNGTGVVPPRVLSLDITPFTPLLTGTKYVGAEIGHFVQKGHWVTVDFTFSKRPEQASPKPPADGFQIVGFGGGPLPTKQVTIPATASEVKARIFTTGHGGSLFCDGGSNNANPCTSSAQCPGGVCNPCDEFCHRLNSLIFDGTPVWQVTPFRTDCSPGPPCSTWNACGFPSCTFPRAGWCPGYIACHHNAPCDNDIDLTGELPTETFDVDYTIAPQNGSWSISTVLYWYE